MKKIATIISRVFDPFLVLVILLFFAVRHSSLAGPEQVRMFVLSMVLMVGLPAGLLLIAMKKKIVSNWDISERRERPKALGIILVIEFVSLILIRPFMDSFLFHTFVSILLAMVGFYGVTLFWKISGHAFFDALAGGFIVLWYGLGWWPVLLVVPWVSWSRVVRRDHTVAQVIAGALYAWGIVIVSNVMFPVS